MAEDDLERVLDDVDPSKRSFLKKLVAGTAFAVPTVASFSVKDLSLAEAQSVAPPDARPFISPRLLF